MRIADALDREHLGKVESVSPTLDAQNGRLHLTLTGAEDRSLEEWTVHAKAGLLAEVFDLAVVLEGRRVSVGAKSPSPVHAQAHVQPQPQSQPPASASGQTNPSANAAATAAAATGRTRDGSSC